MTSFRKQNRRARLYTFILIISCLTGLASCHHTPSQAIEIHRFEKVLFDTPADQLPAKLAQVQSEYATDLLNIQPNNPDFMQMLGGFVSDPVMRDVYHLVDSAFGDMTYESEQLGKALNKAHELYPEMHYDKVYTYINGFFDYGMRVGSSSHELIISLDQYVLPFTEKYGYFSNPLFLVQQSKQQYLLTDCMTAAARQYIAIPKDHDMTLLDYMIAEGKAVYFAQQTLDDAPDSILLRYSTDQLKWMQKNEEKVWSYFLQTKLLYETDYMRFHNFIDDAPKTNAFRDSSPRTSDYIGWRIVSLYMKNNNRTIKELFEETDAQRILAQSNYRPEK